MTETGTPVVSFLVPTGENALYLQECIQSILIQSFLDFEILLLDSGTHPETGELAQLYSREDGRIRHLVLPQSNRLTDSLNHGILQARGELLWFLSPSDRLASSQALKECMTQFILTPRLGLSFCRVQHMDEHSVPYERYEPSKKHSDMPYHPTLYPGRFFFRQLLRENFIPESSAIIRTSCLERAGGLQAELGASSLWQSWLRCSLDWDVFFDPIPKVLSRRSRQSPEANQDKSEAELADDLQSYILLEGYLKAHDYPAATRHQAQLAKLQFMRTQGLKMSLPDRIMRFYRKLTASAMNLNPLED